MGKPTNIQEYFLNQIRTSKSPAVIYLSNGFQLRGIIKGFDNFVVILEADGKQQMIYKHAISTVIPSKHIEFSERESEGTE